MTEEEKIARILAVIAANPAGIRIDKLRENSGINFPLRTWQRRLVNLENQGFIYRTGNKRGTYYHIVKVTSEDVVIPTEPMATKTLIEQPAAIFNMMSQELKNRERVGYNRHFLDKYTPNHDSYLDENERRILHGMGTTSTPGQAAGTYARHILNRLLIDLAWNSSRLEGNTYSLLDTQRLFLNGELPENKSTIETQMILNHKEAIEFLVDEEPEIGINRYTILNLHALLSNNLLPDPAASGRLRTFGVGITQSAYTPPGIPQLIEELFEMILHKTNEILDPFEKAFFLMVHLPYLQPFDDVNKRVSRLAANIPLNAHNLAPLSFTDVPQDLYIKALLGVYELNRIELLKWVFMDAYEKSAIKYAKMRQTIGEPDPFRIIYKAQLRDLISETIKRGLSQKRASYHIKTAAKRIPEPDRAKFIEAAETELLAMHEGNFARYQVTPSEFKEWKLAWDAL